MRGVQADDVLDLLFDPVRLGRRQIDLVQDRDQFEIVLDREIVFASVCASTPCDASTTSSALAGRQRTRNLVREIDVSGRVDQIQDILLAILVLCSPAGQRGP